MSARVLVIRTGTANTSSVLAAFHRLGAEVELVDEPARILGAERVVLPGVGAFAAAMSSLKARGLDEALVRRIEADRPTLGICLGLQLLCEGSEESPGVPGLGLIERDITRLRGEVRIPELGWNRVEAEPDSAWLESGHAYFAHSYCLEERPAGAKVGWTEHGLRFVSAFERGALLACQFHPELSGAYGHALLDRWFRGGA